MIPCRTSSAAEYSASSMKRFVSSTRVGKGGTAGSSRETVYERIGRVPLLMTYHRPHLSRIAKLSLQTASHLQVVVVII